MDILEGSYATYKRATSNFVNWIRTASKGKNAKLTERSSLSHIEEAVTAICEKFHAVGKESISNNLWKSLPGALKSCKKAVEIRKAVGLIYEKVDSTDSSNTTHKHFVSSLESWYAKLNELSQMKIQSESSISNNMKITNIYENLHNINDVEESEWVDSSSKAYSKKNVSSSNEPALEAFDDMFEKDLQLTLLCLLLDMEENMKRVVECWIGVKNGTETIITATVVTIAAINLIKGLEARLQLHYPAFTSYESIYNVGYRHYIPADIIEEMNQKTINADVQYKQTKSLSYTHGALLGEIRLIGEALMTFEKQIPINGIPLHLVDDLFGPNYSEDENPLCDLNLKGLGVIFQQLFTYYNLIYDKENPTLLVLKLTENSISDYFFKLLKDFFTTKVTTLTLVFAFTCWIKSVMALQGNGFLGRCIYSIQQVMKDICNRLDVCICNEHVLRANKDIHISMTSIYLQWSFIMKEVYTLYCCTNPILAGSLALDLIFQYLTLGCHSIQKTSRFRAFGHLYHALVDRRRFPESIPFLDDIQKIYDRLIFFHSQPQHGKFNDTYFLSSNISVAGLSAYKKGKKLPSCGLIKGRKAMNIEDLSVIYRTLILQDYKCPYDKAASDCSGMYLDDEHILDLLATLARYEQFDSRVLSRDVLTMNDYYTDMYNTLVDQLGWRDKYHEFLANPGTRNTSDQKVYNQALEYTLMCPLIQMLDFLNEDGTDFDLVGYFSNSETTASMKSLIHSRSGKAAMLQSVLNDTKIITDVVSSLFTAEKIEKKLFFLSTSSILDEFNQVSLPVNNSPLDIMDIMDIKDDITAFKKCMNILSNTTGTLTTTETNIIKSLLCNFPNLLSQYDPNMALPTVMHQVCGGVRANADLAEWLIHMGGLKYQHIGMSSHEIVVDGQEVIIPPIGKTPLHVAVEANQYEIVKLLVEYDHSKNLNTRTIHEGDTPIHIAIRMNHEDIASYLSFKGADLLVKNKRDKYIYEVAPESTRNKWKRQCDGKKVSVYEDTTDRYYDILFENLQNENRVSQALTDQKNCVQTTNTSAYKKKGNSKPVSITSTMSSSNAILTQAAAILQTYSTIEKCARAGCSNTQDLKDCSRCLQAKYCSKECITADWSVHKIPCKAVSRGRI